MKSVAATKRDKRGGAMIGATSLKGTDGTTYSLTSAATSSPCDVTTSVA